MAWYDPRTWRKPGDGEAKALSSDVLRDWIAATSTAGSGVTVNWQTSLQASVVLACARVIAEGLAQVPFRLMRVAGDVRRPAEDHPLYPLVEWAPNDWQTSTEMFEQLGLHLVLTGNAYVLLTRSRRRIVEMLPWLPSAVEVKRNGMTVTYVLQLDDGSRQEVPASDVWHLRGPSWDGLLGLDVVKLAREAIGLSLSSERQVATTMANGSRISGILSTDATLTKDQRAQLRESWQESQAGSANAGKIAVMSNGMRFVPMSSTAVETQQIENRKFQVEEVCRAMRVLPVMVGATDKASTYASAEAMFQAHVTHTLSPWYRRVEKSAAVSLLTPDERAQGLYFKFFPQALMRGDSKARAAFYTSLYGIGAINPNEIRALEDLNPYDGGDAFRVPLNMTDPTETAAEEADDAQP